MLDWILGYWYCEQYDFVDRKCKKWVEKNQMSGCING